MWYNVDRVEYRRQEEPGLHHNLHDMLRITVEDVGRRKKKDHAQDEEDLSGDDDWQQENRGCQVHLENQDHAKEHDHGEEKVDQTG